MSLKWLIDDCSAAGTSSTVRESWGTYCCDKERERFVNEADESGEDRDLDCFGCNFDATGDFFVDFIAFFGVADICS